MIKPLLITGLCAVPLLIVIYAVNAAAAALANVTALLP